MYAHEDTSDQGRLLLPSVCHAQSLRVDVARYSAAAPTGPLVTPLCSTRVAGRQRSDVDTLRGPVRPGYPSDEDSAAVGASGRPTANG
jgi:hypothetical protein